MPTSPAVACLVARCPGRAVPGGRGRCSRHVQSQTQRGYGVPHQRARDALRATLPALCGYGCGRLLLPSGDWVAAHVVDGNPAAGYLASCRTCNERAKGSAGNGPSQLAQGATPNDPRALSWPRPGIAYPVGRPGQRAPSTTPPPPPAARRKPVKATAPPADPFAAWQRGDTPERNPA
jgi:hypothetical protein